LEIYLNPKYNQPIYNIIEETVTAGKKKTGRPGMNLWQIFILAQTRLALNISYDRLDYLVCHDSMLRQLLGIETETGFKKIEIEYQTIVDNVKLLDDQSLMKINEIIVKMGHDTFKKKEEEALRLKTDSFVVESNVHFPTDYNLLWDSARKCISSIKKLLNKYPETTGWRNIKHWFRELKNQMRDISQSKRKSEETRIELVKNYLEKSNLFLQKLDKEKNNLQLNDNFDLAIHLELDYYRKMLVKHIDQLERRVIKGEKIPHEEKVFSIFEPYTEWITKGKQNPRFELGKNLAITTDQFNPTFSPTHVSSL